MGRTVDTPITQEKPTVAARVDSMLHEAFGHAPGPVRVISKVDYESDHSLNLQTAVRDLDARLKLLEKK